MVVDEYFDWEYTNYRLGKNAKFDSYGFVNNEELVDLGFFPLPVRDKWQTSGGKSDDGGAGWILELHHEHPNKKDCWLRLMVYQDIDIDMIIKVGIILDKLILFGIIEKVE